MTFQRKLLFGFAFMAIPVLLVGAEAFRSNALERSALETLGQSLSRGRTYAEVETAMFNQGEVVWRYLGGLDPEARQELGLSQEVVDYWFNRWTAELRPDEMELADGVRDLQRQIRLVADSAFSLYDAGQREDAYGLARRELKGRLLPALTQINHEIYRRARVFSVQKAFGRVEQIVENERRVLLGIVLGALAAGLLTGLLIARSLVRPINRLRSAMTVVGAGNLEFPIEIGAPDEVGDLARAFAAMTARLRDQRLELERTQAQLIQSEKLASIGEMSAAVAHGLRNPLASLRAVAQLIHKHPESPDAREHLAGIIDEVDRLERRISHLLAFSRPSPFHPILEDIRGLVSGLLPGFVEHARGRSAELMTDLPASLPEVRVDPIQLEQVLVELISNALDAVPPGGRVTVAARPAPDADGGVVIEVADNGRGIPDEVLPQVCDPFFTTRQEGTGLGLAIARRYVEQNAGRLDIRSQVGHGTSATVWLPAPHVRAGAT